MKVAFIHGRPTAHPLHQQFAKSVESEFHFVDFRLRWQDRERSVIYRLLSSFVCAFTFPGKKKYDFFLIDNLHFMPIIMKRLGLIRKNQKIIAHMGSHTLYFIYSHRFSKITEWLHVKALKSYDALICEGKMSAELARKILDGKGPRIYSVSNGIDLKKFNSDDQINPIKETKEMFFIGHISTPFRFWYKGVDLMMVAFNLVKGKIPGLKFTVIGDWDKTLVESVINDHRIKLKDINFTGASNNLVNDLNCASLYLHCARGEAFGQSVLIAMNLGVIPIVSEWTGAKEVVELVDSRLIVPLDENLIAEKIIWFFNLPLSERNRLSKKCIEIAQDYSEGQAIQKFKTTFYQMAGDFKKCFL